MKKSTYLIVLSLVLALSCLPLLAAVTPLDTSTQKTDIGTVINDTAITSIIKSKLLGDSRTRGLKIKVATDHGVVTLTGTVVSKAEKLAASQIASQTTNVVSVKNNLIIKPEE